MVDCSIMNEITDSDQRVAREETGENLADSRDYEVPAIMSDNLVLFPGIEVITVLKDGESLSALREALNKEKILAYVPLSSLEIAGTIGTLSLVKDSGVGESSSGQDVRLKGMWRIRVKKFIRSGGHLKVQFERANESSKATSDDATSLMNQVQEKIDEFIRLIPGIPSEIVNLLKQAETPGALADLCANSPDFTYKDRVNLLGTLDEVERLRIVGKLLEKQLKSIREVVQVDPIAECEKCIELADKAFESDPSKRSEIAVSFLNHVVHDHTGELLALLAEKYGPIFLSKRSLR